MKTREFTLSTDTLDIDYDNYLSIELIEEYIIEDLEVPQECIQSLNIHDKHIDIKLDPKKRYFNDDWYVNLQRVS